MEKYMLGKINEHLLLGSFYIFAASFSNTVLSLIHTNFVFNMLSHP